MERLGSRGASAAPAGQRGCGCCHLERDRAGGFTVEVANCQKFAPSAESHPPGAGPGFGLGSLRLPAGRLAEAHSQLKQSVQKIREKGNCCSSPGPYSGLLPAAREYLQSLWKNPPSGHLNDYPRVDLTRTM